MPTVLLTRTTADNAPLRASLRAAGVEVVELPTAQFVALPPAAGLDSLRAALGHADAVAFTSRYGVRALRDLGLLDALAGARLAVVGPSTRAELLGEGLIPRLVADPATGAALAEQLATALPTHATVLCIQGHHARPELPDGLCAAGLRIDRRVVYENRPPPPPTPAALREAGRADAVYLAAPSAGHRLHAWAPELLDRPWIAIGPTTAASITSAYGHAPAAVAQSPRPRDVLGAILAVVRLGPRPPSAAPPLPEEDSP